MQALHKAAERASVCPTVSRYSSSSVRTPALANAQSRVVLRRSTATSQSVVPSLPSQAGRSRSGIVVKAAHAPPTVAETKRKFLEGYTRPIPALYNSVMQELLVQQHFIRYGINYQYNPVYALGFVSVFDQILDGFEDGDKTKLFNAYVTALGEDPSKYRADAEKLESQARSLSGPDGLVPDASGDELQAALAAVAAASEAGKFAYNRFFAVGLFRLLELTGAKEPAALEKLVKVVGMKTSAVNKDLLLYKGVLSKLSAAKEMMREFLEREKRKQAEREAEKVAKKAASEATAQA